MKKSKELMDNITYKIRNRDEISEQLVYIKVLTSEEKELENLLINKRRKAYMEPSTSRQRQVC